MIGARRVLFNHRITKIQRVTEETV